MVAESVGYLEFAGTGGGLKSGCYGGCALGCNNLQKKKKKLKSGEQRSERDGRLTKRVRKASSAFLFSFPSLALLK